MLRTPEKLLRPTLMVKTANIVPKNVLHVSFWLQKDEASSSAKSTPPIGALSSLLKTNKIKEERRGEERKWWWMAYPKAAATPKEKVDKNKREKTISYLIPFLPPSRHPSLPISLFHSQLHTSGSPTRDEVSSVS